MSAKKSKDTNQRAKHWIGTIPVDSENAKFWENPVTLEHIAYIKLQEEIGHGKTQYNHYQVYMCLNEQKRLTWIKKHIHATGHWEIKRGTVAEAIDYVSKEDTRKPDGITFEHGTRPKEQTDSAHEQLAINRVREKDEIQIQAQTILDELNNGKFIPWRQIPVDIQMKPGFLMAYNKATRDMVGPMRPNLRIITLIGPPGCGKSYAISKVFPDAGRWIRGNNGDWFTNTKANVMVFEEYSGQIQLQSMLKYLDPYPLALEVKGGTEPAMYNLVIITSNTPIESWYTNANEFRGDPGDPTAITSSKQRRIDALGALWDRLGYKSIARDCGRVYELKVNPSMGDERAQILSLREQVMEILINTKKEMEEIMEKSALDAIADDDKGIPAAQPACPIEHESLSDKSQDDDDDDEEDDIVPMDTQELNYDILPQTKHHINVHYHNLQ